MLGLIAGFFIYAAIAVFVVFTASKALSILKMPRHLRWDLYPVAHDGPKGSPFQEMDVWSKPRRASFLHAVLEMAEEIMFLKRTFLHNRKMWFFTYPMHLGFYLASAWLGLLAFSALIEIMTGITISINSTILPAYWLYLATWVTGLAGLVLGLAGTAGLLWMRLTDEGLQDYTAPITMFNLFLILALFGVGLVYWLVQDPALYFTKEYIRSVLVFNPLPEIPPLFAVEIFLFAFFLLYLPFSRMLHFVAKYFFYHDIMWEDEPVRPNSSLENSIKNCLGYNMEWSGPHMSANVSWLEQAVTNPALEVKPKNETESKN